MQCIPIGLQEKLILIKDERKILDELNTSITGKQDYNAQL